MKIIVLSDTHIPERAQDMPARVYADMEKADMILHAGDMTSVKFFKKLDKIKTLKAVQGNMDELGLKEKLPVKQLIKIGLFTIGLIHGWGSPFGLIEQVRNEFAGERTDMIVFGHSHQGLNIHKNGIIFFNPGSPTDKIFSKVTSYGIITINDKIEAKIINI